uniref:Dipeptidase n=1 Tax=Glossina pallidipes TaxID=7398 RepID=A0A1B0AIR3_GLOPL
MCVHFWAAYVPCEAQHRDAVQLTLEQIDVIKRLTDRYAPQLTTCTSAQDIIEAHKNQQLCSLTGVEGGHSLGGSLAVLRTLYAIGVRYMTLTSTCHTPWADSSYADAPTFNVKHGGLTIFGKEQLHTGNEKSFVILFRDEKLLVMLKGSLLVLGTNDEKSLVILVKAGDSFAILLRGGSQYYLRVNIHLHY